MNMKAILIRSNKHYLSSSEKLRGLTFQLPQQTLIIRIASKNYIYQVLKSAN